MNETETVNVVELVRRLSKAKRLESAAKIVRIVAEKALIAALDFKKPEGQETYDHESDAGTCKVVLKQPINTTVDSEAWLKLRRTLPPDHPGRKCFRAKYEVRSKEARALQDSDKSKWSEIADVITRKPGKVQVEIKSLEITG